MNLAQILTDAAQAEGDRVAVRLDDVELTYAQLDGASAHIAGLLHEHGFTAGDRVGIMLPNVPYFPACYYGVLRAGGIVVPMNVLLKRREVAFYLRDSGAKLMFAWDGFEQDAEGGAEEAGAECLLVKPGEFEQQVGRAEPITEVREANDDDTAVILYTSGTTGTPKGAELTHGNLRLNAQTTQRMFGLSRDLVMLGALPLFHSFGQSCAMNATTVAGGTLTLIPRFDPAKALEIIERDQVNMFQGVPTMYGAILHLRDHDRYDTSSLERCVSGGSAMPLELMRGFEEAFGCIVLEGYGLSESSPVASFNHPDRERKPGSIGTPVEGVQMRVVDEDGNEVPQGDVGEILIRGHNVMKGYWNRPDATEDTIRDGWLHTGDMGYVDEDGYFFIVDRKKDMIIRGGYNVYPREIEEVLYEHPAVREAAVVGIPHDEYGEEVGAAVALKDGQEVGADELRQFVKEQVAAYKYPRRIWFVEDLPKGPTGKILKREIDPPGRGLSVGEVRVRGATRDDVELIYSLVVELAEYERGADQVTGTPELLAESLFGEQPAAEAVIAERDGVPVGFALFHGTFSTWECRPGIWLEDLYVPPQHRRGGVGRILLSHLARLTLERGCTRLEWNALDWNEPALDFYQRIGATRLSAWELHRLDGEALRRVAAVASSA